MALTKERKILTAIAGVACAIFVADRVLMGGSLSGPQSASAASVPTPPTVLTQAVTPVVLEPEPLYDATEPTSDHSLAKRLEQASRALPSQTPDAFTAGAAWQVEPIESEPTPAPQAAPQDFARQFPLDAVYQSGGESRAMVAGQPMHVGQTRHGMTLKAIGDRWVLWEGQGVVRKVHLDGR